MARHKKLTDQLSSVRYLHVLGRYNAAADSLATEAFESKMGRVVLSGDRKAELKELNRISEVLYARADSADSARPKAEIAAASKKHARRVRFENETKLDPAKRNQKSEQHKLAPVLSCSEAKRLEFESPGASSRVRRVEGQAEASADKSRVPDSVNTDPAVMHAGRRRRISKTQDEELRWADRTTLLVREPDDLAHRRGNKASKMTDDFELSELDKGSDKYEVEAVLDDKLHISTSTSRAQHLFKLKWVGYDEPTWEPLANLSCGSLLLDYLRDKKLERRLQMVQVAAED
ncbi:unnamed protein product [Phytophthora fragariaefolia]|uniref:Unnamed protein product n=1 Tax=Phytophthora fragariaefolia TaxID=1490495 RepID=A0A9W7D554_9STRA|nr:unnamed protein product [Phytophthora fragariaefolia]